jgi:hypothetical protein
LFYRDSDGASYVFDSLSFGRVGATSMNNATIGRDMYLHVDDLQNMAPLLHRAPFLRTYFALSISGGCFGSDRHSIERDTDVADLFVRSLTVADSVDTVLWVSERHGADSGSCGHELLPCQTLPHALSSHSSVVTFLYADDAIFAGSQTWSGLNVTGHNREACELHITLSSTDQPLVASTASLAIGGFTVPVCALDPAPTTSLFTVTGTGPLSVANCLFLFADDTHSLTVRSPIVSITQGPLSFTNCEIRGGLFNASPISLPNTAQLTFAGNRFVSLSLTNSSRMLLRYGHAATNYAPRKIERCSFVKSLSHRRAPRAPRPEA